MRISDNIGGSMYYFLDSLLFLWTESSFYPGGERGNIIDLVVQRDKLSGLPMIRGSSLKGAIRSYFELNFGESLAKQLFGDSERASPIVFSDAHVLFFPIRELFKTFIYITGRIPLQNLLSILELGKNINLAIRDAISNLIHNSSGFLCPCTGTSNSCIGKRNEFVLMDGNVRIDCEFDNALAELIGYLLKLSLPRRGTSVVASYKFIEYTMKNFSVFIGNDTIFREYVDMGIERVTRIGLDYEKKVVKPGHLFVQEIIPRYALFFSAIFKSKRKQKAVDEFYHYFFGKRKFTVINIGGDESIGRGIIRLVLYRL